jgi:hypothetical protein
MKLQDDMRREIMKEQQAIAAKEGQKWCELSKSTCIFVELIKFINI